MTDEAVGGKDRAPGQDAVESLRGAHELFKVRSTFVHRCADDVERAAGFEPLDLVLVVGVVDLEAVFGTVGMVSPASAERPVRSR